MQIIENVSNNEIFNDFNHFFNTEEVCFFDIETTGFAAEYTKLYLIGCCHIVDNKLHIIQWFNDDGVSEAAILDQFMNYITNYKYLLHYNGDGFDIPYIDKKCKKLKINNTISSLVSIDLYKQLKPFKHFLHLDNLKLKTIEQFLGIYREDQYSGGDLIEIYNQYLKLPTKEAFDSLTLHNYEDIENLVDCFVLMALGSLINKDFEISELTVKNNNLCFSLTLPVNMPKRVVYSTNGIVLSIYKASVTLSVPILEATLRMFYDNPSEYYYLPAEDMAIHKSIATYVDKSHRIQAKRENCYCKIDGFFISQLTGTLAIPYKKEYTDKENYIMLDDSFFNNNQLILDYVECIIKQIIK